MEVQPSLVTPADKQLLYTHLVRNFLERLFGVSDRERNQDGSRPVGNLVNVEPEPVGEQHNLRRDCRDCVVVILTEETEVNLGESVDLGNAAQLQYFPTSTTESRMIGFVARQL